MEKYFGEKQERFSFRKLSVGLVSATISSLFFMSVLASSSVDAQETAGVHYKYVADSELSSEEKKQLVYDIPTYVENDDETYYLVYKLNSQNQLAELPNTGSKNERQALVAGASLAALGILIFAVSKKKVKNKTVLHLVLVAGIGNGVLVSVHALENHLLLNYNTDYELTSGEKLPLPKEISGYTYIGYIKEGKTTSDFEVSNQEKSAATPIKQQKVDYNVTPNFVDHPSTVQAIQEQTPVSSTKPTEVQVVEKPFSTELINPRKEEKQSSDSQEQLAEHKNLETKKEEKISPKEKTGVNTLNPQDEVLSGQLNKPELLYREETIETKIDFQEEIQENPDLAEGTVRVKQEGKLGKKVEIVRIFSVNKEEVSREIVSTSTTAPSPRIVEKGTKKTQVIKEQPETGVEHKDVQSGAIVEPAIQPELPEAVVSEKGTPGDLMGRRIAYELLAAKGFKDGMVPYISNQYEEDAKQQGQTINLYGKERGLVTDELVLKKVFDGKYKTWAEFKTAMYQERVDQFGNLKQVTFKDPTKRWPSYGTKTINNVDELQKLMDEAVLQDATGTRWSNYNPETDSAVHKLKRAIFKAYLDQTNDFRSSIFENKK